MEERAFQSKGTGKAAFKTAESSRSTLKSI